MQNNHVFTSGATGTNAAVIRGALRAEKPHLLTVVLPQSLRCQPSESQELLQQVLALVLAAAGPLPEHIRRMHGHSRRASPRASLHLSIWQNRHLAMPGQARQGAASPSCACSSPGPAATDAAAPLSWQVQNIEEMPQNDYLSLMEASRWAPALLCASSAPPRC